MLNHATMYGAFLTATTCFGRCRSDGENASCAQAIQSLSRALEAMSAIRKVYLFGVRRHAYQIHNDQQSPEVPEATRNEFMHAIEKVLSPYAIASVAEEMSLKALIKRSLPNELVLCSVLCRLACKMCLPYRLCDLEPCKLDDERERIWRDQLNDFNVFPALFVAGRDHVVEDRFANLLTDSGFQPSIIERDWKAPSDPIVDQWYD